MGHGLKSRHVLYYLVRLHNRNKVPTASTKFNCACCAQIMNKYVSYLFKEHFTN